MQCLKQFILIINPLFAGRVFSKKVQKSQSQSWYRDTPRFLNLMIFYFSIAVTNCLTILTSAFSVFYCMPEYIGKLQQKYQHYTLKTRSSNNNNIHDHDIDNRHIHGHGSYSLACKRCPIKCHKRNTFYWHFYLSQTRDLVKEATINAFFGNLLTYWIWNLDGCLKLATRLQSINYLARSQL